MRVKRISKQILITLICFIIALCLNAVFLAASEGNDNDVLVVGVPVDRCPIFYLDADTKEITGIGADLMRYAAQEAG